MKMFVLNVTAKIGFRGDDRMGLTEALQKARDEIDRGLDSIKTPSKIATGVTTASGIQVQHIFTLDDWNPSLEA